MKTEPLMSWHNRRLYRRNRKVPLELPRPAKKTDWSILLFWSSVAAAWAYVAWRVFK